MPFDWPSVVMFGMLLSAIIVGPKFGADPQLLGAFTTTMAALFVQRKKDPCPTCSHDAHVDNSPEGP